MLYASEDAVCNVLGLRHLRGFSTVSPKDRSLLVSQAMARLAHALNRRDHPDSKVLIEESVHDAMALTFVGYGDTQLHPPGHERKAVARMKERIVACVEAGEDLNLSILSDTAQLSKSYLIRATRKATGLTPHGLIMKARMEKAHRLLLQKTPAAEAAIASGFYDQAHLIRQYRRHYGVTPGAVIRHL